MQARNTWVFLYRLGCHGMRAVSTQHVHPPRQASNGKLRNGNKQQRGGATRTAPPPWSCMVRPRPSRSGGNQPCASDQMWLCHTIARKHKITMSRCNAHGSTQAALAIQCKGGEGSEGGPAYAHVLPCQAQASSPYMPPPSQAAPRHCSGAVACFVVFV